VSEDRGFCLNEVTFLEIAPSEDSGFRVLGKYAMTTTPRRGETVVLQPALGGLFIRYAVKEVIHPMPELGNQPAVTGVAILLIPILSDADVSTILSTVTRPEILDLMRKTHNHPATAPPPPPLHAYQGPVRMP
jgi:hypothetical protein